MRGKGSILMTWARMKFMALAGVAALLMLGFSSVAQGDSLFYGDYSVSDWTTTLTNSDGSVNTSGAPGSVLLTGGNNLTDAAGTTLFSITVPADTVLTFDWTYTTDDTGGAYYDPAGYEIDGTKTQLSPVGSLQGFTESGVTTVDLTAGETFAFYVYTRDNEGGAATLDISTGSVPAPEPSSLIMLGSALLALACFYGLRKRETLNEC